MSTSNALRFLKRLPVLEPTATALKGERLVVLRDLLIEQKIFASKRDADRHARSGTVIRLLPAPGTASFECMTFDLQDVAAGRTFALCPGDVLVRGTDPTSAFIFEATFDEYRSMMVAVNA